jgi:heptosyltransferase-2
MKICIIKLGAKGDVVRTLSILPKLHEQFPEGEITWITEKGAKEIFINNPYVNRILSPEEEINDSFDILYSLDTEKEASDLALKIKALQKKGFFLEGEYFSAFNFGAEYYLNTIFDDEFKRENKKTVQEMMFMACDLDYNKEYCPLFLSEEEKKYGELFVSTNKIDKENLVGIQIGASVKWPSRFWREEEIFEFIQQLNKEGFTPLLFGSPRKEEKLKDLMKKCEENNIKVYCNDIHNTDREFFSLVHACKLVVAPDSFAMHVSLALGKSTIALFFCTSADEIENYNNLLTKIVSPRLYEFFPEKMDEYNLELIQSINPKKVAELIDNINNKKVVNAIITNSENKFLVIKRREGLHKGKWAFPGGEIKKGETSEEALKREIKEEVNLELSKIIKKISDYNYLGNQGEKKEGECYLVEVSAREVKINDESEEFRWVSLEELEELDYVSGIDEEALLAFSEY